MMVTENGGVIMLSANFAVCCKTNRPIILEVTAERVGQYPVQFGTSIERENLSITFDGDGKTSGALGITIR